MIIDFDTSIYQLLRIAEHVGDELESLIGHKDSSRALDEGIEMYQGVLQDIEAFHSEARRERENTND